MKKFISVFMLLVLVLMQISCFGDDSAGADYDATKDITTEVTTKNTPSSNANATIYDYSLIKEYDGLQINIEEYLESLSQKGLYVVPSDEVVYEEYDQLKSYYVMDKEARTSYSFYLFEDSNGAKKCYDEYLSRGSASAVLPNFSLIRIDNVFIISMNDKGNGKQFYDILEGLGIDIGDGNTLNQEPKLFMVDSENSEDEVIAKFINSNYKVYFDDSVYEENLSVYTIVSDDGKRSYFLMFSEIENGEGDGEYSGGFDDFEYKQHLGVVMSQYNTTYMGFLGITDDVYDVWDEVIGVSEDKSVEIPLFTSGEMA